MECKARGWVSDIVVELDSNIPHTFYPLNDLILNKKEELVGKMKVSGAFGEGLLKYICCCKQATPKLCGSKAQPSSVLVILWLGTHPDP